mgnify:FL=1|jgi:uncharacterized GH25 family protein
MKDNKLALMIKGHEIWLGEAKANNSGAELSLFYGHNMKQDGSLDPKRITPLVYTPAGATLTPSLAPKEDHYMIKFSADGDGYYTTIVDLSAVVFSKTDEGYQVGPRHQFKNVTYAGAFHQMAKHIIPIGKAGEFKGDPVHGILEIVPRDPMAAVGGEAELRVYYEGKPLPAAEVKAVSQKEGKDIWTMKTDEEGAVRGPIRSDGEWMFLVRHVDPTKKASDEFDETVFVNTLVMEAR